MRLKSESGRERIGRIFLRGTREGGVTKRERSGDNKAEQQRQQQGAAWLEDQAVQTLRSIEWIAPVCGEECSFASLPQLTLLLTFGSEPPALNWLPRLMCRCLPLDCGGLAPALLTDSGVSGTPDPVGLAPTELLAEATCAGPSLTTIDNRLVNDPFNIYEFLPGEWIDLSLSTNVISRYPQDQGLIIFRLTYQFSEK